MRSKGLLLILCFTLTANIAALSACGLAPEKSGPFRGQVIDLETGKPIPDVAILVLWWEAIFSPTGHPTRKFYEAREGATGPDGRFEIPRLSLPLWKLGIQPGEVMLFAPGYVVHAEVVNPPDGTPFVDPTVIQMRHLKTREELLKKSRSRPGGVPLEKMKEFTKAINVERKMLGLDELSIKQTPRSRR
ncbi:MAG: hypothetical protein ACE5JQ_11065 [Candidatus Methylomirabilales bacterium]